ncbi:MAG: efflux RND transporter permease subunit, partial [Rikenellaceae bacterium]
YMGGRIKFTFFPTVNEDNFSIDLAMKPGVPTEKTVAILDFIEGKVREADTLLAKETGEETFIEILNIRTGTAFSNTESGEHAGTISVFLRGLESSSVSSDIIKKKIADHIGKIPEAYKFSVGASNRFGAPVSISLFSSSSSTLENASEDLKEELTKISALYNISDNNQLGSREVHLTLKPLAYSLGLTASGISTQVRAAFYGVLAQRIQEGRNEVWFYVRYPEEGRKDFQDLETLKIRTTDGGEYPLSQLCDFKIVRGVTKVNHFNSNKEITVSAYMLDPKESVLPILDEVNETIMPKLLDKYPDLSFIHQGQVKDSQEEAANIAIYFSLAFIIITLILIIYFRSITQGFMILAMIPMSFLAAIWGHLIEGALLSMMSIWGMVALSGTIINDAVVFMSRYNDLLIEGKTVVQALVESGRSRFRPIMLTSITTTIGLFPLIKETSSDAEFVKPMAISLGYGILLGTIFILALFPALVKSANTGNMWLARLRGKKNVTPESVETALIDHQVDMDLDAILAEDEAEYKKFKQPIKD